MNRYTFYASDMGGELPGEGSMEPDEKGGYVSFSEAQRIIRRAVALLEDPHVQANKFRFGVLGQQLVDSALDLLKDEFNLNNP